MDTRPRSATAAPPIIGLPAEVDATNCDALASELNAAFAAGASMVIADLSQTTFCDSSAVRVLLQAHKVAVTRGIQFELVVNSPSVLRVLELTGLLSVLGVHQNIETALSAWRDTG